MTSPDIIIQDTAPYHLREMATAMQTDSAETAFKVGMTPLKALWESYRQSLICKSIFINGNLAAIFGISGTMFAEAGKPWLVMTPETQEYPMRVAFRFRKELNKMSHMFPILEDYVEENNEKAIRLLELMGFKVSKNRIPMGNIIVRRAERRV